VKINFPGNVYSVTVGSILFKTNALHYPNEWLTDKKSKNPRCYRFAHHRKPANAKSSESQRASSSRESAGWKAVNQHRRELIIAFGHPQGMKERPARSDQ